MGFEEIIKKNSGKYILDVNVTPIKEFRIDYFIEEIKEKLKNNQMVIVKPMYESFNN